MTGIYSPAGLLPSTGIMYHLGARRHGQGALAIPIKMFKCSLCCKCCLKSRLTKYLCIILRKCFQLLGASPQTATGSLPLEPTGGLPSFRSPHYPSGKNPAGAHALPLDWNYRSTGTPLSSNIVIPRDPSKFGDPCDN